MDQLLLPVVEHVMRRRVDAVTVLLLLGCEHVVVLGRVADVLVGVLPEIRHLAVRRGCGSRTRQRDVIKQIKNNTFLIINHSGLRTGVMSPAP